MGAFANNDETLTAPLPRRSSSVLTLQDIVNGVCRRNGAIAQTVMRARDRHKGQSRYSAAARVPASRGVPTESSPKNTADTAFDSRARSQSGAYVIFVPYSLAIKQRPLRRACLASASVVPGASGSKSPRAPKKAEAPLKPFQPQSYRAKSELRPCRRLRPTQPAHAESHGRRDGVRCEEAPAPPTYRRCAQAHLSERQRVRSRPAGRRPERQDHSCRLPLRCCRHSRGGHRQLRGSCDRAHMRCRRKMCRRHKRRARTKAGVSGDTSGPAYSRQAIVVPAFSTVKSMLCPHHQRPSSCASVRLDRPALLYALLTD